MQTQSEPNRTDVLLDADAVAALGGTPNTELNGIAGWPNLDTTGVDGPITWEALHTAVVGIRGRNYQPNGIILSPAINGALNILTTGDGTNAAKS
jgi:hypothetical protein